MSRKIRIQMMDTFAIYIDEKQCDQLVSKSRKGLSLVQLLIMSRGKQVPNQRLLSTLWTEESSSNPENALKTLVSRIRTILNQAVPELGSCIVADRGAYHWEMLPGMTVDVYEIEDIFEQLISCKADPKICCELSRRLMELYRGDLLENGESNEWAMTLAIGMHNKYMAAVYAYVELLKAEEDYAEVVNICRAALDVDNFDDRLHMELMTALIKTDRANEALEQYKHATRLYYRYLGIRPSDDMQEFYKYIVNAGKTLEFNLEAIRSELCESNKPRGAFICEYTVFKEIFNLQMRNLERLGSTMFLAVIMVSDLSGQPMDAIKQDNIINGLMDILRFNLRKGDTVTHFNPTTVALLLPTVNYTTGNMVMERIKRLFYKKYPNSGIAFNYQVGPLSSDMKSMPLNMEEAT